MIDPMTLRPGKPSIFAHPVQARLIVMVLLMTMLGLGCSTSPTSDPPDTQSLATDGDPAQAEPSYWLSQPAVVSVRTLHFDHLMSAAQDAARNYQFRIDRTDYRRGLITTQALVSKQWFEVWRKEVIPLHDQAVATVATIRRTVRFDIQRLDDGRFELTPKVVVERQANAGRRVTTVTKSSEALSPASVDAGSAEADAGVILAPSYWYATGRDETLERALVRQIEKRLSRF